MRTARSSAPSRRARRSSAVGSTQPASRRRESARRPRRRMFSVNDKGEPSTRGTTRGAMNVPSPRRRTRRPSFARSWTAWRAVIRDTENRSHSSASDGSRSPGRPAPIWRRRASAISRPGHALGGHQRSESNQNLSRHLDDPAAPRRRAARRSAARGRASAAGTARRARAPGWPGPVSSVRQPRASTGQRAADASEESMTFADIKAAVVGVGFIGVAHVEALRRLGVDVVGVVGSDPDAPRRRRRRHRCRASTTPWKRCSPTPRSTSSTSRPRTTSTHPRCGRCSRPESTSCARSRWR